MLYAIASFFGRELITFNASLKRMNKHSTESDKCKPRVRVASADYQPSFTTCEPRVVEVIGTISALGSDEWFSPMQ